MKRSQLFLFLAAMACLSALATTASAQVAAPYLEDFESEANCTGNCGAACVLSATGWTNDTVIDTDDWTVDTGGTSSGSTGPSVDHTLGTTAGKYLYTETSGSCSGGDDTFFLISPPLDVTTGATPFARFWYHMLGAAMGTMHVDILDNTQAVIALDVIPSFTDNQDLWQQTPNIDLTPYLGQIIHVRIRGVSGTSFTSDMAIDDFEYLNPVPNDVGVASIDTASPACGAGLETVTVTLENFGTAAQSNFNVQYIYDGGTPVVETFTGTLAAGATASFSFAAQIDLSVAAAHTLDVATLLAGDQAASNDSDSTVLNTPSVFNTFPFIDDMEGAAQWVSGGAQDEWELGTPASGTINGANSGVNAWVTDLDNTYNASSDNFIEANGCFDFSGLANPAVQLAVNWDSEFSWDGAVLQSSVDGGGSWQNVGAFNDGATNWYNDNSLNGNPGGQQEGWTGTAANSSGGWVLAQHEMSALAGQPDVRMRIAFGSDGSVQNGSGFAFDDFQIFDNTTPEVVVSAGTASVSIGGVAPGTADVVVQSLSFTALGNGNQEVNGLTITKAGNIMDVYVTAKIYVDDGNGVFNPMVDTLVDTQPVAGGTATFNTTGAISIPSLAGSVTAFIAYDLDVNSMAGETFGSSVVAVADVTSPVPVTIINAPLTGPLFAIAGQVSMLPFTDDFTNAPLNLLAEFAAGVQYPLATQAGASVMLGSSTSNDAQMAIVPTSGLTSLLPVDGTNFLVMNFPNSAATAALDYSFDLSAYTAATDLLWLEYVFGDVGADNSDEDNIFVSLDGGATWVVSLRKFDGSEMDNTWNTEVVNVSTALANAAQDYSNDVVIRFQNADNIASEAWMLDRVTLGEAPRAEVERVPMTVIPVAGVDAVGTIGVAPQSFMYTITNTGDFNLPVANNSYQFANELNVSNTVVTGPTDAFIAPGASISYQVDFEPGLGAFSVDVSFITTDPYIFNNTYQFTISGEGAESIAEIDVQRPAGTSIASGMNDTQGEVTVGETQTLTYTIENVGFGVDLNVSGASIANANSATGTVTTAPAATVAPGMTTTFDVEYTADAAGAWSFEVVVASDDADEGTYTIVVDGTAVDAPGNTGGGGSGAAGGAGGTGGSTGGSDASGGGGTNAEDDGGCGCTTPGGSNSGNAALLGLWALGMVLARRRQRRN